MKEIILDTETTGLSVREGHRIVEIGCVELDDLVPTDNANAIVSSLLKLFTQPSPLFQKLFFLDCFSSS